MRKQSHFLFCLFGLALLFSFNTHGQQYTLTPSLGNFVPLIGGTAVDDIEVDDNISATINLGFTFNYFGQDYTQVQVSSNGFITFDLNWGDDLSNSIGVDGVASTLIAPLWDDLSGIDGQASYTLTGNVGSRIFTMEWVNWRWRYSGPVAISFQASLYETTNEIRFVYRQEVGALEFPSASIGIVGTNSDQFISLTPPLNDPQTSITGDNLIGEKPVNGQTYSFLPSMVVVNPPTIAATNIGSTMSANSGNFSWANGDGEYRAVFLKEAAAPETFAPVDNQTYNSNSSFGSGNSAGNGWYCVYNGTGSSVNVSNLKSGFSYRVHVIEYNGLAGSQKYFAQSASLNPITTFSPLVKPSTPVSTVSLNYVAHDRVRFNLTEGSGSFRAIFIRAGTSGLAPASDNSTYAADAGFGNGTQIQNSGWYCVFNNSSATDLLITGLTPGTSYKIHVVDYNGPQGSESYNITSESAAATFSTFPERPVTYNFAASSGNFSPVVGGANIPSIQDDDELAPNRIPIGFTFFFNGIPFTELTPSSNGFLSFNPYIAALGSSSPGNDLSNSFARPLIAPLWDDIDGIAGQASYVTTGTAPNRVFTIQYLNWQWNWQAAINLSFQVKLYEADNKIEFVYRQEAGVLVGPFAAIGLAFANINEFASLNNSGVNPTMSTILETTSIAAKPATGQVYSFTPSKLDQAITFDSLASRPFAVPNPTFQLTGSTTSGLALTYTSSDPLVATISGNTVTVNKVGETTITAEQPGNSLFNSAVSVQQLLTIVKGDQAISFPAIASKKFGDAAFTLNASASSGLAIAYESTNPAVATVNNNQITVVGVGSATITAKQPGNENYNPAADVQHTLTVQKAEQQITFAAIPEKIIGDAAFIITATSSAGLPVTLASSNNAIATVSGHMITIVGHGIVTITASQAGNANYNPAAPVQQSLKVRANQTITFAEIPAKKIGDANFTLSPNASSSLAVQLSTSSNKITLTNGVVSIVSPGTVTITANQPGDDIFFAAPTVSRTFCINPSKPTISVSGLGSETPVLQSSAPSNNQWFKDGVALAGQTGSSLNATAPGMYSVRVIVDGCSSDASESESLIITGINPEQDDIQIFPNPARDRITIDVRAMNLVQEVPIVIIEFTGREVLQSAVQESVDIDISKLRAGNYQILIKHGRIALSKEFVKH